MKIIYEYHQTKRYRINNYFDVITMIFNAIRFAICLCSLYLKLSIQYWNYDLFCFFLMKITGNLSRIYILLCIMIALLGLVGKFSFFLIKDISSFNLAYNLVVRNTYQVKTCTRTKNEMKQIFDQLYKHLIKKNGNNANFFQKQYFWILAKLKFITDLNYIDLNKLNDLYPERTKELLKFKAKFVFIVLSMDRIFFYINIIVGRKF